MILLKESSGDVRLAKFIYLRARFIEGQEKNYHKELDGYLFVEEYTYNRVIGGDPDDILNHTMIYEHIPDVIKRNKISNTIFMGSTFEILKDNKPTLVLEFWSREFPTKAMKFIAEYLKKSYKYKLVLFRGEEINLETYDNSY